MNTLVLAVFSAMFAAPQVGIPPRQNPGQNRCKNPPRRTPPGAQRPPQAPRITDPARGRGNIGDPFGGALGRGRIGQQQPGCKSVPRTRPEILGWQDWWDLNRESFINVRGRYHDDYASQLTARTSSDPRRPRRPSAEQIETAIRPVLQSLTEEDSEIAVAALLGLARSGSEDSAELTLDRIQDFLRDTQDPLQVQGVLALGVLGEDSTASLTDLLMNRPAGRRLLGQSSHVPETTRAFAAIALGVSGGEEAVDSLISVLDDKGHTWTELRSACVMGLGLLIDDPRHRTRITRFLMSSLEKERWQNTVLAHIPTALAKSSDPAASSSLVRALSRDNLPQEVLRSCAMAMGRLAAPLDPTVTDALLKVAKSDADPWLRQLSWIALGELAARSDHRDGSLRPADQKVLQKIVHAQRDALRESEADTPWIAISAGIVARQHPMMAQPAVSRLMQALEDGPRDLRGAAVLALGISEANQATTHLQELLKESGDEMIQGYAAEALGMLRDRSAKSQLLNLCMTAPSEDLRYQAALGLGYLADPVTVKPMIVALQRNPSPAVQSALTQALGEIGDGSCIDGLTEIAKDESLDDASRSRAVAALGMIARAADYSWNWPLKQGYNFTVTTSTMGTVHAMF